MRIAVGSDERTHLTERVVEQLRSRGLEVELQDGTLGLVSALESRIKVIAERDGISFDDSANFHMMLNTHTLDQERAASIIIHAVSA